MRLVLYHAVVHNEEATCYHNHCWQSLLYKIQGLLPGDLAFDFLLVVFCFSTVLIMFLVTFRYTSAWSITYLDVKQTIVLYLSYSIIHSVRSSGPQCLLNLSCLKLEVRWPLIVKGRITNSSNGYLCSIFYLQCWCDDDLVNEINQAVCFVEFETKLFDSWTLLRYFRCLFMISQDGVAIKIHGLFKIEVKSIGWVNFLKASQGLARPNTSALLFWFPSFCLCKLSLWNMRLSFWNMRGVKMKFK